MTLDVVRLRRALVGSKSRKAYAALAPAARAAGVRVVSACIVPCGMRAVVATGSHASLRMFVRRFVAWTASPEIAWRPKYRTARVRPHAVRAAVEFLTRLRVATPSAQGEPMIASSSKARGAAAARQLTSFMRHVDRCVDGTLGTDEAAARVRRYVGDHDAPPDDREAFARLCASIFAFGIGAAVVAKKWADLSAAFAGFDPLLVAEFDAAREAALLESPIIRNPEKIRACVENARRWRSLAASHGTYLARIASIAAVDDPNQGWPSLANIVKSDFAYLGDSAARQVLKRWGFFTAAAHPGARRCLERLGLIEAAAEPARIQCLIGAASHRLGRDAYAVEAALALFAGEGPCRKTPACDRCPLADRCPSAMAQA